MKKMIALAAMICLFASSGISFAQEYYTLQVVLESDPESTDIPFGEAYLNAELGDEITFSIGF